MKKAVQYLEVLTNLAIVLVIVLLGVLFISKRNMLFAPDESKVIAKNLIGKTIAPLDSIGWSTPETLVIAIKRGCQFCENSFPFYRELTKFNEGHANTRILAVLPDEKAAGEKFLADHSLKVNAVFGKQLGDLYVPGTPTLLIVGGDGQVRKVWIGKLSPDREKEVADALVGNDPKYER